MNIIVDGKPAMLKHGFSFEYVSENRLFLGRDGYTLSIAFPLKDCPQNIDIFGHINRMDVVKNKIKFDCNILSGDISLAGSLTVVKVSEGEIECQFAEGRCARSSASDIEETYIDTLNLGQWPSQRRAYQCSVKYALRGLASGFPEVALPWVNEDFPEACNNWIDKDESGNLVWHWSPGYLSWQPYLLVIAERICLAAGFNPDFTPWKNSPAKYLIICNTLPPSWNMPQYAKALPHWTVGEFFDKLELLLGYEFIFDIHGKTVKMRSTKDFLESLPPVNVEEIVDAYSGEIDHDFDSSSDYLGSKVIKYDGDSSSMWNYYSCDDFINKCPVPVLPYDNISSVISRNKWHQIPSTSTFRWGEQITFNSGDLSNPESKNIQSVNCVLYAEAEKRYFLMRSIGVQKVSGGNVQKYILQPLNIFGSGLPESDIDEESLDIVPVSVDATYIDEENDQGPMMFLRPGSLDNDFDFDESQEDVAGIFSPNNKNGTYKTWSENAIASFSPDSQKSFYDKLLVAFWNGTAYDPDGFVYPYTDSLGISQSWQLFSTPFSLSLSSGSGSLNNCLPKADMSQKFKFSWLATEIPSPRAIFHIRGRRYLCEKITATFTENGMSQLLKGEFYPLLDEA